MQATSIQAAPGREAAYDALQRVILQLATRPPMTRQPDRNVEFKTLVEQALEAYRNYMKAVGQEI